eukprot:TRINITY_DN19435_c0_g1_i2.p1 TRINITY_DN19435_c0_g1~~TRINITY_DN19435_c0_g1_i2.p1  ORF type:complete len:397 (+),score=74.68 TRINITY_DN19435_c0_g1_i2:72-1262(+)
MPGECGLVLYWRGAGAAVTALDLPADATVADLAREIELTGGPAVQRQHLRLGGILLADPDAKLSDVGLSSEATIAVADVAVRALPGRRLDASATHMLVAGMRAAAPGAVLSWDLRQWEARETPDFGGRRVLCVAAGHGHSLAVLSDGTAVGWGSPINAGAEVVPDLGGRSVLSAAAGLHSVLCLTDGSVVSWGFGNRAVDERQVPDFGGRAAVAVAAGTFHSLVLLSDGSVQAWGSSSYGQCDVPDFGDRVVVGIACGELNSIAWFEDRGIACWGYNYFNQCTPAESGARYVDAASGEGHTLALTSEGAVEGWGSDMWGQLQSCDNHPRVHTLPSARSGPHQPVRAVAASSKCSLVCTDTEVRFWGWTGRAHNANVCISQAIRSAPQTDSACCVIG